MDFNMPTPTYTQEIPALPAKGFDYNTYRSGPEHYTDFYTPIIIWAILDDTALVSDQGSWGRPTTTCPIKRIYFKK